MLGSRLGAKRGGGYGPGIVTEDERSRRVRAGYVRGAWRVRAGYGWGTGGACSGATEGTGGVRATEDERSRRVRAINFQMRCKKK